jgi:hypothetical protein
MDKFIIVFSSAGVARASTSISSELDPETITSEVIDRGMDRGFVAIAWLVTARGR